MDYVQPNDDSMFYLDIRFELEGKAYTLHFSKKQKHLQTFDQVNQLDYLLQKRMRSLQPQQTSDSPAKGQNVPSESIGVADQLREFKALLDESILTQEEFEAKKKKLLNI